MKRVNKELGLLNEDSSSSSGDDEQDQQSIDETTPNIAVDIHNRSSKTLQKGDM